MKYIRGWPEVVCLKTLVRKGLHCGNQSLLEYFKKPSLGSQLNQKPLVFCDYVVSVILSLLMRTSLAKLESSSSQKLCSSTCKIFEPACLSNIGRHKLDLVIKNLLTNNEQD